MRTTAMFISAAGLVLAVSVPAQATGWVNFADQTATRLQLSPPLGASDVNEKSYEWADLDQDGDMDLVIARKQPMASAGRRENVLLMNEAGILVDRTVQYATASDVAGDLGFKTETNDRDVEIVDVNGDGWLDLVTATTYGQGLPQHISHPRVYINLGQVAGVWQGFKYESARIPTLGNGPNFCYVASGDVTNDGAPDLYFVDYDHGSFFSDVEDVLLINNGQGFFTNETATRVAGSFSASDFGTACEIVDFNGDGKKDIVKSENGPLKVAYNNGSGLFIQVQVPPTVSGAVYHVSVGDLNGDGRMDLVTSDDGIDTVHFNQSTAPGGMVNWFGMALPASTAGFGSNSYSIDLNRDGTLDVFVASVDVRDDPPSGCPGRVANIVRNGGTAASPSFSYDPGNIPDNMLLNVFDFAIFDISGDCWPDLVVGRCTGTQVWIQQPPVGAELCPPTIDPCPADFNDDGAVSGLDLATVLGVWTGAGTYAGCSAGVGPFAATDLNQDCKNNGLDVAIILGAWGPCNE